MNNKLKKIATKYKIEWLPWGIKGGHGWLSYKQIDINSYKILIDIIGDFNKYSKIKNDIVDLFSTINCSLSREHECNEGRIGYCYKLFFIDTEEFNSRLNKKSTDDENLAPIYNIGQINADRSIVTLGNIVNPTQMIDNSIHNIEQLIEKNGQNDKEELYSILDDAKEIVKEINQSKHINQNATFTEKLSKHFSKHGWFYGEIINLLGTALLSNLS